MFTGPGQVFHHMILFCVSGTVFKVDSSHFLFCICVKNWVSSYTQFCEEWTVNRGNANNSGLVWFHILFSVAWVERGHIRKCLPELSVQSLKVSHFFAQTDRIWYMGSLNLEVSSNWFFSLNKISGLFLYHLVPPPGNLSGWGYRFFFHVIFQLEGIPFNRKDLECE